MTFTGTVAQTLVAALAGLGLMLAVNVVQYGFQIFDLG